MGVDLGELCVKRPIQIPDLAGKTIAIDAYNTLYQFLASIRQPDGLPMRDAQGRVTSHLLGLLARTANLVENGITPIYCFDGIPHPLKLATLRARAAVKEAARQAYDEAIAAGDMATARSKAQQTSSLSKEMVDQARALLTALGLPWMDAPSEGEAQATALVQQGRAHAVASQDYDAVLCGAPRLVRNLAITGRRKLPSRQVWVDVEPEEIPLAETLEALHLDRERLIDVAILIGTDYNPGVNGIGPKRALELVREHGGIEDLLVKSEGETGAAWKKLREGQDGLGDFEEIRRLFLTPKVSAPPELRRGSLDEAAVKRLLVEEHQFREDRVESSLAKFRGGRPRGQQTLGF